MMLRSPATGQSYLHLSIGPPSLRRYCQNGFANTRVGTAPAEIAAQAAFDILARGTGMLIEKRLAGDHETRSAEPALLGIVIDEGGHHRVQAALRSQALDGFNTVAFGLNGEHI